MDRASAAEIVGQLADGVDPMSGEELVETDTCQQPRVIRALILARTALDRPEPPERAPRIAPGNAGKPWTDEEDALLLAGHDSDPDPRELASRHDRTEGAIRARLVRLGKLPAAATRFRTG